MFLEIYLRHRQNNIQYLTTNPTGLNEKKTYNYIVNVNFLGIQLSVSLVSSVDQCFIWIVYE